ncbi:hypothetical protein [Lacticaseibacillus thailandensis]|uniref:hypothetical protein n=1 Tax=Lacticaseibacillus thailandensis TaxID=381741 RepID=UPI0021E78E68|nr:hypothetical protein [Lacticaseibacillus thailandensis]
MGKTTLIRTIMGQRTVTEGQIIHDHTQDLRIGYVPSTMTILGRFRCTSPTLWASAMTVVCYHGCGGVKRSTSLTFWRRLT